MLSPVRSTRCVAALLACGFVLSACQSLAPAPPAAASAATAKAPSMPVAASSAYREAAARHLYQQYASRIYAGPLPPVLYAVGVLAIDVDAQGQLLQLQWRRAPEHAPEVVAEIEALVRRAAPYPAPGQAVRYSEVWLWDESGRFQLDTLTEGQLQEPR